MLSSPRTRILTYSILGMLGWIGSGSLAHAFQSPLSLDDERRMYEMSKLTYTVFCSSRQAGKEVRPIQGKEAVFSPESDCPADSEMHSPEEIQSAWDAQVTGAIDREGEYAADWSAARDLNVAAARLWAEIIACSGDAESARAEYVKKDPKCKRSELAQLRAQIGRFLETSHILDRDFDHLKAPRFPLTHPLFVQLLLEHLALFKVYEGLDFHLRSGAGPSLKGLASIFSPSLYTPHPSYHTAQPLAFDDGTFIQRILAFMAFQPNRSCGEWGLWPRTSRSVLYGLTNVSETSWAVGVKAPKFAEDLSRRIRTDIESRCGSSHQDAYIREFRWIVGRYREMGKRK